MSSQFIQIREEPSRTEIAKDILCAMLIAELEKKKP